ncbi:hypothetical protein D3C81_270650 [compost metagenome]
MQINKSVMEVPGIITRDQLFNLRIALVQLYKCRAYADSMLFTPVYGMTCQFNHDDAYKLELMHKGKSIFSFHPTSKIIEWDQEELAKACGFATDFATGTGDLGWAMVSLFDLIYREHAGFNTYIYDNMTTSKTRRDVKAFYGLLHAVAKLSKDPLLGDYEARLVRKDNGYAVVDKNGLIVFQVSHNSFSFGMGYLANAELDANIEKMILKYRPWAIDLRKKYSFQADKLRQVLRDAWRAKNEITRTASNAVCSSLVRGIKLQTEFAYTLPNGTVICFYDDSIMIKYNRGGLQIGNVMFDPNKVHPVIDTSVLDYLRGITLETLSLKDDFGHALIAFAKMITDQVVGEVEQATLKKLNLSLDVGHAYYEAFMKVRGSGYRGDFETFATLLKQVQG